MKNISHANIYGISLHANVTIPGTLVPKHLTLNGRTEVKYIDRAKKVCPTPPPPQNKNLGISLILTTEKSNKGLSLERDGQKEKIHFK